MIQFNLLPDVKLEYIKARRSKRLVMGVASLVTLSVIGLTVMLFIFVGLLQKKHMTDLRNDINKNVKTLQSKQDLDKVLTIQNQLNSLNGIHDKKPVSSRLFGYLTQITPNNVTVGKLNLDYATSTIIITGEAKTLLDVNRFVDTLKFTDYTEEGQTPKTERAFSKVVLTNFGATDKGANYTITFNYAPVIFDSKSTVHLTVPQTVTTRSTQDKPTILFKQQSVDTTEPSSGGEQ